MPRKTTRGIDGVSAIDLSFAVSHLIAAGKTTIAEVKRLVAERASRIESLKRELQALKAGRAPTLGLATPVARAKRVGRPKGSGRPAAKARATKKGVKVIKRKNGTTFTRSLKVQRARKQQGQYLGILRGMSGPEKAALKAIAREKGVPAALAAARKRVA